MLSRRESLRAALGAAIASALAPVLLKRAAKAKSALVPVVSPPAPAPPRLRVHFTTQRAVFSVEANCEVYPTAPLYLTDDGKVTTKPGGFYIGRAMGTPNADSGVIAALD